MSGEFQKILWNENVSIRGLHSCGQLIQVIRYRQLIFLSLFPISLLGFLRVPSVGKTKFQRKDESEANMEASLSLVCLNWFSHFPLQKTQNDHQNKSPSLTVLFSLLHVLAATCAAVFYKTYHILPYSITVKNTKAEKSNELQGIN